MTPPHSLVFLAFLSLLALTPSPAHGLRLWAFKEKRFKDEAFINAGSLGLGDVKGRVIGVGDWNGDQKLDLFTLSEDGKTVQVQLWNRDKFQYIPSHTLTLSSKILNVVPGDYSHDGKLDLLVMYEDEADDGGWWGSKVDKVAMEVFLGGGENGNFQTGPWKLPSSTPSQPFVFDADGSLRPSLLGYDPSGSTTAEGVLRAWKNNGTGITVTSPPLQSPEQACVLANPHSSAFIDIDGDCLPDLVLHCARLKSSHRSIQIWSNRGEAGYVLSRTYDLPKHSGMISFADINDAFDFSFDTADPDFVSIPLAGLLPVATGSTAGLQLHLPGSPSIPFPLRPGDFDVDGFPDLLIILANSTAAPPAGGVFGASRRAGTQVKILKNVPCGKGVAGCEAGGKGMRGFKVGSGKGWETLDSIWDAEGASWIDLDDDGSLDILVQRTGEQSGERVTFVQNNFYHDAFFLKAQVLNGACEGDCQPATGGKSYSPLGVSYSGATYKFTVLDTLGRRVAQQVAQLPQTGYHALHTPYAFFGLGRTNNYIEKLFIGASLSPPNHATYLESLIPNSQVIINPPYPASSTPLDDSPGEHTEPEGDNASPVKARSLEWKSQLYLKPGDWVPWVGAAVLGTVLLLGAVVVGLNEKEKKEDEKERRRALHAINFQAL
nr:uncharacterized protein CI109_001110 [Kwoniella shandongensis]KAA5530309.1 hypothetical protein CI109_001110 [Kwoniella shandongensis]